MRHRTIFNLLIALMLTVPAAGFAQGRLVPVRWPQPRPPVHYGPFTVKSMAIGVDITRQVAVTTIEQVFANPADRDQEGIYLFPVPKDASITKFSMWMNGEEVEGEIVEAGKARQIYEDIVRRMRDPGLLEYIGRDLFRARVYPIPARGEVKIKIVYAEVLRYDGGVVEYTHPLRVDGNPSGRVDFVSLAATIESDIPIKSLYSPTHEIDSRVDGRRASCGFEFSRARLNRDFVLYYTVSEEDVGLNLLTHRTGDKNGYFMMLLSPGKIRDRGRVMSKDIVFVMDKSGSMKGEKIEQARRSLAYCIHSLNENDRFNIVAFSTAVETYADGLVRASRDEKNRADDFIDNIRARGGTDINEALLRALKTPASRNPKIIVFLTDGLPTVGETNIERILENLRDRNDTVRIFSFGVGFDVNTALLDRICVDHRGTVDYVKPEENIEVKVSRFFDKVGSPVLSDIELDVEGIELFDVYPRQLPDLFEGTQLVVLGRYEGSGEKAITLKGDVGGRSRRLDYEGRFELRKDDFVFIPRLWANRKIAYLLSEIRLHGASRELVDEVIELSLEHGIITPYTSWLILEEGTERDRVSLQSLEPGRTDLPAPGSPVLSTTDEFKRAGEAYRKTTGADAFDMSAQLSEDRETAVEKKDESGLVRFVDGVRFVKNGEVWVDERFETGMDTVDLPFLSDEYFELLEKHPGVEKFLALGDKVTFVFDNQVYRITE
jgi:Ca-activated chloride channel family protein